MDGCHGVHLSSHLHRKIVFQDILDIEWDHILTITNAQKDEKHYQAKNRDKEILEQTSN
jgi:hypothetical protein